MFAEYGNGGSGGGLDNSIPIAWHGDEGRGKRRGNTVCVSMESVIGVETVLRKKRKLTPTAGCRKCQPPGVFNQKYSTVSNSLDADMLAHVHVIATPFFSTTRDSHADGYAIVYKLFLARLKTEILKNFSRVASLHWHTPCWQSPAKY